MRAAVLEACDVSVSFGKLTAVRGVNLTLRRGERHALIGPNGAGKTTLINLLAGELRPGQGVIRLHEKDITRRRPDERARLGLVRTFQVNSLFPDLTVLLSLVLVISEREGLGSCWWQPLSRHKGVLEEARYWLNELDLADHADIPVRQLPYGHQRLLEIGLALACKPRVLLLDEPAAGLSSYQSRVVLDVMGALPGDLSILLIEHDMDLVFGFADTISVLSQGQILARGTPDQIAADKDVRAAYLGPH